MALATISINLINKWAHLKRVADPDWRWLPTYLPTVVPRILTFLEKHQIHATLFVCGQDAIMPEHRDCLRAIVEAGHEIGNQSYHYDSALTQFPDFELSNEIVHTEEQIHETTGFLTVGFRSPGQEVTEVMAQVLLQRGYQYDSSIFGRQAFHWRVEQRTLLEIPATSPPLLKSQLVLNNFLYLARLSRKLADTYLGAVLALGSDLCIVASALDFLSDPEAAGLNSPRSTRLPFDAKLEALSRFVSALMSSRRVIRMDEYARDLQHRQTLRLKNL